MVGPVVDKKVRKFLMTLFKKGEHISHGIASTTANVLLSRREDLCLKNIKTTPMWGRSIFQRLGFRRQIATTGKVEDPEGARKEAGLQHHFQIVNIIEKHNIPKSYYNSTKKFNSCWFGWTYRPAQHYIDFYSHTQCKNITTSDNLWW